MKLGQLIPGTIMVLGGAFLISLALIFSLKPFWIFLVYGIPIFVIGLIILLNTKEDSVEEINLEDTAKKGGGK